MNKKLCPEDLKEDPILYDAIINKIERYDSKLLHNSLSKWSNYPNSIREKTKHLELPDSIWILRGLSHLFSDTS